MTQGTMEKERDGKKEENFFLREFRGTRALRKIVEGRKTISNTKKFKRFFCAILFLISPYLSAQTILCKNGNTTYEIVTGSSPTAAETNAAKELKNYLKQATGADFKLVPEDEKKNADPAIYVGNTQFATKNKMQQESFDKEEWMIQSVGKNIVITGGRPRGVIYGVYEFLERFVGCRWYSINMELVPTLDELKIPETFLINAKPAFTSRCVYHLIRNMPAQEYWKFVHHVRLNAHGSLPEYGFTERYGSPGGCHTYLAYAQDFPESICWMNPSGKRISVQQTTGGQICYSNLEVRSRFIEKLRNYIKEDRVKARKEGAPYPIFYDVSANDCSVMCHCEECKELARRYGVSGMVIDFTNAIAAGIEKEYPDIKIMMMAYKESAECPKNIKARDNVIIRLAFMDAYFGTGEGVYRDVLRPLNHPHNMNYKNSITEWGKYAKNLAIWDYWIIPGDNFLTPKTCISSRADYVRKYRDMGVTHIFIESEVDERYTDSFVDLRTYLGAKLLINPDLNVSDLIDDFMNGFYGKAAKPMKEYLNYLEKRMTEEKSYLALVPPVKRAFLDEAFFTKTDKLISEAEKLAANQPKCLDNVRQERLVVDCAYLNLLPKFKDNPPLETKKEIIINRMLENLDIFGKKCYTASHWANIREKTRNYYLSRIERPDIPKRFAGENVVDLIWADMQNTTPTMDKDAVCGKAISVSTKHYALQKPFHGPDVMFGIYARDLKKGLLGKTISKEELPQDEKYHFYYLGRTKITPNTVLWCHWSWQFQAPLGAVYDPMDCDTLFDVYVSLKLQGPSYVKTSKLQDDFLIDRAIFVRVNAETARDSKTGM